ncbi:MAG TPA: M20 family metallopeptidase [Deferrisomatales bacterium]|nr:M20 family metallopeptidase [Deferrisomatales bacterium]
MGEIPLEALRGAAASRRELVMELQRRLHRIPELAFQERKTTRLVQEFLDARGVPFDTLGSETGGAAVLGDGEPVVILRADLDALPVTEAHDGPDCSGNPGVMHACGHDAHVAMLLATVDALAAEAVPFSGRVVCLFQPAEEGGGGCARFLERGLLERYPARAAVALHVWPQLTTGSVALSPGPVMAGMDTFALQFAGRGGHGAYPHACIDPVVMAAEAVLALQTLVSRRVDPLHAAVVTVGRIQGGTASNIIPDTVEVEGTLRAFTPEVRDTLMQGIRDVSAGVAQAHRGACRCTFTAGYPVTTNHAGATETLRAALEPLLGPGRVVSSEPTMGSEDMSFLLARVPGCYLRLGAAADPTTAAPLHSSRFRIDEDCLPVGVATLLTAVCALGS